MSEQAIGPLDPIDPPAFAATASADLVLFELRDQIRELEDELRDLERRTEAAERRLEGDDPASPFARRAADLGHALARDIVHKGRSDIRSLLADAHLAAEARTAGALREAHEVLAHARADVADAMQERSVDFERVLTELAPVAPAAFVEAPLVVDAVATREPVPVVAPDPASVAAEPAPILAPEPTPPGPPTSSGRDPMLVVALLEASVAESVAAPLGSPIGALPVGPVIATPVTAVAVSGLAEPAPPAAAEPIVDLPAPPDRVETAFADLATTDASDPFAGDTPATTSQSIDALADLTAPAAAAAAAPVDPAAVTIDRVEPDAVTTATETETETAPGIETAAEVDLETVSGADFWDEQEHATRTRWLRPVEILVPMVLALLLFVGLLLWVG